MRIGSHLALVVLFPLLLYARTADFGFVRADDADLIAGNQAFLSDLRNVPRAFTRSYFEIEGELTTAKTYYRPVAIVSFMLDAVRGGARPRAYHITNVVLHAAAVCLLFALAGAWGASRSAAAAAALVFAVHPLNVQAVAWVAGRNDLLAAVFGMLSLLAWNAGGKAAAMHPIAFALALFSKETAIVFPAVCVLHHRLVLRKSLTPRQWVALGCDAVVIAAWVMLRARALAGMPSEMSADTLRIAFMNLPQLLVHAGKMLAPVRLNVAPGVDAPGLLTGAVAVLIFAAAAWRWMPTPMALLAAASALLFLLPTLVVPGLPVYEHRAYLPLIGMLAALAAGFRLVSRRRLPSAVSTALIGAVLGTLAIRAHQRLDVFRDPVTYWTDGTRDPRFGPIAHVNLGQLHEAAGRPAEARREYLRALERDPHTPKAHNNLGVVLMRLDEPELALRHFQEEAQRHPWNAEAWFNLGLWHETRGSRTDARRFYQRALIENPNYLPAYEKLDVAKPPR